MKQGRKNINLKFIFFTSKKFIASLHIYLASILGRYPDISEVGDSLQSVDEMKNMRVKVCIGN